LPAIKYIYLFRHLAKQLFFHLRPEKPDNVNRRELWLKKIVCPFFRATRRILAQYHKHHLSGFYLIIIHDNFILFDDFCLLNFESKKVKQILYRPGQALRLPGG